MPKVSPEHEEQQHAAILTAARRCFARNGFHATSMDDIITQAGMSPSTVYRHFRGKDEIIYAATDEKFTSILTSIDAAISENPMPSPSAMFTTVVRGFTREFGVDDDLRQSARLALNAWGETARNPRLATRARAGHQTLRSTMTSVMEAYRAADMLRPGLDPGSAADAVWMMALGLLTREVLIGDRALDETGRILDQLLLPRDAARG
ncbi:MAG: helix-turn-helix domain-containing protein [Propionibacterium sp.]